MTIPYKQDYRRDFITSLVSKIWLIRFNGVLHIKHYNILGFAAYSFYPHCFHHILTRSLPFHYFLFHFCVLFLPIVSCSMFFILLASIIGSVIHFLILKTSVLAHSASFHIGGCRIGSATQAYRQPKSPDTPLSSPLLSCLGNNFSLKNDLNGQTYHC